MGIESVVANSRSGLAMLVMKGLGVVRGASVHSRCRRRSLPFVLLELFEQESRAKHLYSVGLKDLAQARGAGV